MTRKERLMAVLKGEPVDRPPVCFYEINGYSEDENDPDPFNIYNHPSWKPLLKLAREKTDRIIMCYIPFLHPPGEVEKQTVVTTYYDDQGRRHEITEIKAGDRTLRQHTRRDSDVNTVWILEHFIKDETDLEAWIALPSDEIGEPDYRQLLSVEKEIGDTGIVMIETGDALCEIASLMDMEEYMIIAMTEQEIFHKALKKAQEILLKKTARIAKDLPGRLWRIYGPEYAAPPYLPPKLYKEYVTDYDRDLVGIIQKYGGFARIHQHGRQKDILEYTAQTGCTGLDPIEPFPQGDVELSEVRKKYGQQMVLFGGLEICDIEQMNQEEFKVKVEHVMCQGTQGDGKGFVLMPSSCPLGRVLSENAYKNYEVMMEVAEGYLSTTGGQNG